MSQKLRVAVVTTKKGAYSETFISQHILRLPFSIYHYFGKFIPDKLESDHRESILHSGSRFLYTLKKALGSRDLSHRQNIFYHSLKKEKIDVVLAEYGPVAMKILPVIRKLGLPMIVHFHGADLSKDQVIKEQKGYRPLFDYASSFVVVSRAMEKKALELGFPPGKTFYNVYGPHDRFLDLQPTFETQHLLAIGRFTDKKAPYLTLLAFEGVLKKIPEAKLIFVGAGSLLPVCRDLAAALKIGDHVDFLGIRSPEEISDLMLTCRAFVQHSVTAADGDMEGTPLSILEAQAAGLPVISTRHAGIPDIVVHGQTGLLVEEKDVEGMTLQMLRVLENPEEARAMGAAGKQRIREHFTLDRHIDTLARIISSSAKPSL